MENEQLIHDYINDRLSPTDKEAFENKLATDTGFASEVKEYKDVKNAIRENERSGLKSILQDLESKEATTSFSKRYRHIYIAAAVIIFAIIGSQFLQKGSSNQDLYASFYQPYPNTLQPVTRGEEGSNDLSKAFQAYEANDFKKAATLFDASLKANYNTDVLFYKAMSLYNIGKQSEAANLLNKLKKDNTNYTPQIYWYSALLDLKNNNIQRAKEQLDSLTQLNSGYKQSAIVKIKRELND